MKRGDSLTDKSSSFGIYMYATVSPRKAVATVSRGSFSSYSCNRGYASYRSLTPVYVLSPAWRAQSTVPVFGIAWGLLVDTPTQNKSDRSHVVL